MAKFKNMRGEVDAAEEKAETSSRLTTQVKLSAGDTVGGSIQPGPGEVASLKGKLETTMAELSAARENLAEKERELKVTKDLLQAAESELARLKNWALKSDRSGDHLI